MKKTALLLIVLAAVGGGIYWLASRPAPPREVDFTRAVRQKLVSVLTTNGRVEPVEFASVRAELEGPVKKVLIDKGQHVAAGQALVAIEVPSEVAAAESRIAQAQAELQVFERGGAAPATTEIENGLAKVRLDLKIAQEHASAIERLVTRNAEPRSELIAARDRVQQLEIERNSLERRKSSLLPAGGREAAMARLRDAQSALAAANRKIEQSVVHSPISGTVYNLAVKKGGYLRPGDLVAEVGHTETLRAILYVDEPELGRVAIGMPVRLTWDAAPGQEWKGDVQTLPTQIAALNSRQVGEVICRVENGGGKLPPGANMNAEILSKVVENALTVPKSVLRREGSELGVFVLAGNQVQWRPIKVGTYSVTHAEVTAGLKDGDAVALATETALKSGEPVIARFP